MVAVIRHALEIEGPIGAGDGTSTEPHDRLEATSSDHTLQRTRRGDHLVDGSAVVIRQPQGPVSWHVGATLAVVHRNGRSRERGRPDGPRQLEVGGRRPRERDGEVGVREREQAD